MGVRPHQTNTAHFTECSEGLLDTLQMNHSNIQKSQINSYISVTDARLCGGKKDH